MKYSDAIKNGFHAVNRNWQLVFIHTVAMFTSFMSFFIVVGIPLAIAFVIFGIDLTGLSQFKDVFTTFKKPSEILSRYFTLAVIVLGSILLYMTMVFSLWIFVSGGTMGVIGRFLEGVSERFHLRDFASEGKRLFFPLLGFSVLIGIIFFALSFVLGILVGSAAAVYSLAQEKEVTLAVFLGTFFSLIISAVGLVLILAAMSLITCAAAAIVFRRSGPMTSLKQAVHYLYHQSNALYFCCSVFLGYSVFGFFIISLGFSMTFVPLIGPLVAAVYQFIITIAQLYLALIVIATIFCYYYASTLHQEPVAGESIPETDIFAPEASEQEPPPQGGDEKVQA